MPTTRSATAKSEKENSLPTTKRLLDAPTEELKKAAVSTKKKTTTPAIVAPAAKKPKKTSSNKASKSAATKSTPGFRVIASNSPKLGSGCYRGRYDMPDDEYKALTTTTVVGVYATKAKAVSAARKYRDSVPEFEDWATDFYNSDPPPYFSCDGENNDDDDSIMISIVDISKEISQKRKKEEEDKKIIEKARQSKHKKSKPPTERRFGPQKGNFAPDPERFLRNPCRIEGGAVHMPGSYGSGGTGKSSFSYLVQCISDRNYTMRSVCVDRGGARYTSFKKSGIIYKCVVWIPDSNLNDHADDDTIVDAVHLELFARKRGNSLLTAANLEKSVTPNTKHLYLCPKIDNETNNPTPILNAIKTCAASLETISLVETCLSNSILEELAKCPNLKGFTISDVAYNAQNVATDAALAQVILACPQLSWIFCESNVWGAACWNALWLCHNLEVLWVHSTTSSQDRYGIAKGNHDAIRQVLQQRAQRGLKLCMVNPDEKLQSSWVAGKKKDTLEGKKFKVVEHDCYDDMYFDIW